MSVGFAFQRLYLTLNTVDAAETDTDFFFPENQLIAVVKNIEVSFFLPQFAYHCCYLVKRDLEGVEKVLGLLPEGV